MLLKIINRERAEAYHVECKNVKIESRLSPWERILSFDVYANGNEGKVACENYVETETDEYVIKEVKQTGEEISVVANLNLEGLESEAMQGSSGSVQPISVYLYTMFAASDTEWEYGVEGITKERRVNIGKATLIEGIEKICDAFLCEMRYDTINKIVHFEEKIGTDKGAHFLPGLNLKELTKNADTNDFATQIYPVGADGLTIETVNEGEKILKNNEYSNKKITVIWEDDKYTDAQALKEDAEYKLSELAKPKTSYSCKIIDLASVGPGYEYLKYGIGDIITIPDGGTLEKQRIVKTVEYPEEPEKNECELSNTTVSFEDMQKKLENAVQEAEEAVSGGNIVIKEDVEKAKQEVVAQMNNSGNAATATKLKTERTIDGIKFGGDKNIHHFGTCYTSATAISKTMDITGFALGTGAKIAVHFLNGISVDNATLNVSGTGAKEIKHKGKNIKAGAIPKNTIIEMVYNGSWQVIGELNCEGTAADFFGTKNLNDYTIPGKYVCHVSPGDTWQNAPNGWVTSWLDVYENGRVMTQVATEYEGSNIYIRGYYEKWSAWKKITSEYA